MTLPKDKIYVQGYVEVNLSSGAVAKPISVAPDVWYGVMEELSVGLIHSRMGGDGFFAGPGTGLCLTGSSNGCANVYNNVGIDARYHLFDGTDKPIVLAADGGLFFRSLDPFAIALKVGAVGKKTISKIDLVFGASLVLGLTERDAGNKEVLSLPISAIYPVSDKLGVGGQTGLVLPFSAAGDTFLIPLSVAARYIVSPQIAVEGVFSFPALLGGSVIAQDIDGRVLSIGASYLL